jgi:hypothetical protein
MMSLFPRAVFHSIRVVVVLSSRGFSVLNIGLKVTAYEKMFVD